MRMRMMRKIDEEDDDDEEDEGCQDVLDAIGKDLETRK
jgi:hypothetical protein